MDIDPIRSSTLTQLAATENETCISILMPTHQTGRETRQDPIRLSNLLDQVHEQLKSHGMRDTEIEGLLKPARDVVHQSEFWRFQGASLAVYLSDGVIRMLRMPEAVDETIMIGPHFDLKPLLGAMASSEPFYVLAFTKQQAKLYRATRSAFEEVVNEDFPLDAVEIVGVREGEAEIQHHSGMARRGSRGDRGTRSDTGQSGFHGHGEGETKIESDTLHYLKEVAERVANYLYEDDTPLILAADISLVGLYRREHLRGNLIDADHVESPDALTPHEIHDHAWKIAAPALEADLSSILDRFGTAAAGGKAAQGYEEVAIAAAQGKVDTLFFDPRASQLGWIDDGGATAHLVEDRDAVHEPSKVEDLVNRAIIDTLRCSGRAIPIAANRGKESRDAEPQPPKAILRY